MDVLRAEGPQTASELLARTGLSRPTVHVVCAELIDLGWVAELDPIRPAGGAGPGRSARRYAFQDSAALVVGIDMGVHTVTAVLADLAGAQMAEMVHPGLAEHLPATERLGVARDALDRLLGDAAVDPRRVLVVAVGVPGPVDPVTGVSMARDHWLPGMAGADIPAALGRDATWDVLVDNDCNVGALAEMWRGVATGLQDVVFVLAGERLGAGVVVDGRLLRGRHGAAGELSYLFLVAGVGNADGIGRVIRELGEDAVAGGWHLPADGPLRAEDVFVAAATGDPVASDLVDRLGRRFARIAGTIDSLLQPQLLVFGGGIAPAGPVFLPAIRRHLDAVQEQMMANPAPTPLRIEASALGDHAVVIGAVRLALNHVGAHHLGMSGQPIRPAPHTLEPV